MSNIDGSKIANSYKKKLQDSALHQKNAIAELNSKIERLQPVKDNVSGLKQRFHDEVLEPDKKVLDDAKTWKGSTCNHFKDAKRSPIKAENEAYFQNLDNILDSMEDELTRLRNQVDKKNGFLGDILAQLRTFSNEWIKAFN